MDIDRMLIIAVLILSIPRTLPSIAWLIKHLKGGK